MIDRGVALERATSKLARRGRAPGCALVPPVAVVLACSACSAARVPAAAGASENVWEYRVAIARGAETLEISASFPPGSAEALTIDKETASFVRGLESWQVECESGCRVEYRFALAEAARAIGDARTAQSFGDTFVAPPSSWLVRPNVAPRDARYRIHVDDEALFATGLFSRDRAYEAAAAALVFAPFTVFGDFRRRSFAIGDSRIDIAILGGDFEAGEEALVAWVHDAAETVGAYFGRFPVERVLVVIAELPGAGFGYGTTLGNGGASIFIAAGRHVSAEALRDDWQMTHEIVHLAFPNLPRDYRWLEEGIATYVEPIARARAGRLSTEQLWRELVEGLPNGQPEFGDRGLDRTQSWGRVYWGGAMFCFLADLEIRKQTDNRRSLDDALRGILSRGGNIAVTWSLDETLAAGDRATGTSVLSVLHDRYGKQAVAVDLAALWSSLGVRVSAGRVELDDRAPLATLRRALTNGPGR